MVTRDSHVTVVRMKHAWIKPHTLRLGPINTLTETYMYCTRLPLRFLQLDHQMWSCKYVPFRLNSATTNQMPPCSYCRHYICRIWMYIRITITQQQTRITITQQQTCITSLNIRVSPAQTGRGWVWTDTDPGNFPSYTTSQNKFIVPVPNSKQETAEANEAIATLYLSSSILGSQTLPQWVEFSTLAKTNIEAMAWDGMGLTLY